LLVKSNAKKSFETPAQREAAPQNIIGSLAGIPEANRPVALIQSGAIEAILPYQGRSGKGGGLHFLAKQREYQR